MYIDQYEIKDIDQVNAGDTVVVIAYTHGCAVTVCRAEVSRKLKTKFELTYDDGSKTEYSSRIGYGGLKRYGAGIDSGFSSASKRMYQANDVLNAWCEQEDRKRNAAQLRRQMADLANRSQNAEVGTSTAIESAREIANMAQRLVALEEEISKADEEA